MKFESYNQYKNTRDDLLAQAQKALNEGNTAEKDAKVKEIEKLDTEFENWKTEQANFRALAGKAIEKPEGVENMGGSEKMGEGEKVIDIIETKAYRNAFLRNLQGKEIKDDEKTMLKNTAVSGASMIPTLTMNRIIGIIDENPVLSRIDLTFIPSNISFPKEESIADASWLEMGTASTDSEDSYTYISLTAHKLIKTVEINADVEAMSIDAFESWLVTRLGNKIERALNYAVWNGTGNNQPTGILKEGQVELTGNYSASGMTYKDLMNMLAALPTAYHKNASISCGRKTFFGEILGITDEKGNKVVVADAQSPAKFNVLGYPVIPDDTIADGKIAFGDLFQYKMNLAKAPTVEKDNSVGFRSGSTVYRSMALADGKQASENSMVIYDKEVSTV